MCPPLVLDIGELIGSRSIDIHHELLLKLLDEQLRITPNPADRNLDIGVVKNPSGTQSNVQEETPPHPSIWSDPTLQRERPEQTEPKDTSLDWTHAPALALTLTPPVPPVLVRVCPSTHGQTCRISQQLAHFRSSLRDVASPLRQVRRIRGAIRKRRGRGAQVRQ